MSPRRISERSTTLYLVCVPGGGLVGCVAIGIAGQVAVDGRQGCQGVHVQTVALGFMYMLIEGAHAQTAALGLICICQWRELHG